MGRGLGFTDAPVHLIPRDTSSRKATTDSYHPHNLSIFQWKSEGWASYIVKSQETVSRVVRNSSMKVSSTDGKALR